jgi:FtsZ-interacting cell division protein ZipA
MKQSKISIVLISVLFIPTLVLGNVNKVNACHPLNPFCSSSSPPVYDPSQSDRAKQERIDAQAKKEHEEEQARERANQDEINRATKAEADRVAVEAERAAAEESALAEKAKAEERAEADRVTRAESDRKAAQAESDRNSAIVDGIGALGRILFPSKK